MTMLSKQLNRKRTRDSNLELLRIISMFLVMFVHYLPLREPTTAEMVIIRPSKALLNLEFHSIAIICVNCFILISGYFGIRWKWKSFANLLWQLLFWAIIGYFIAAYLIEPFITLNQEYSLKQFLKSFLDYYQGRWFVSAYLTLYIFSPVINAYIDRASTQDFSKFIIIFYAFSTIYGYFIRSIEFNTGLSAISLFGIYMIGAWLRKADYRFLKYNRWIDLGIFFFLTIVLTVANYILLRFNIEKSLYGYLNPIVILESMALFQFFRKLDIGSIRWINFIASSAFAAFLFHCHPFIGNFYSIACRYCNDTFQFSVIYVTLFICAIFGFTVLLDKIRIVMFDLLSRYKLQSHNELPPCERNASNC